LLLIPYYILSSDPSSTRSEQRRAMLVTLLPTDAAKHGIGTFKPYPVDRYGRPDGRRCYRYRSWPNILILFLILRD